MAARGKFSWALGIIAGGLAIGWALAGPLAIYLMLFPALVACALAVAFFAIRTAIAWRRNKVERTK